MNPTAHIEPEIPSTQVDDATNHKLVSGVDRGDRRKHQIGIARKIAIGVLALLFAVWLILFVTKGRFLKGTVEDAASSMTGREVAVEGDFQLYFAPFGIKFLAEGLSVSNPAWATRPYLFKARKVDTRIAPFSLLFGSWRLYSLDLTDGAIDLEWNARRTANTWTFDNDDSAKPL